MELLWELLSFVGALVLLLAVKGLRFGTFYVLLVLLLVVPLGAYFYVHQHHPDRANLGLALLVASGVGLGVLAWVLFRLRRAGTPEWEDLLRAHPVDAQAPRASLAGRGWLYRRIRLSGPYRCDIQYRFSWNHDPFSPVFGEELVLVNDRLVHQHLARSWFGLEYPFELTTPRGKVPARLRLRFRWPSLRIYAVQLEVDGQVVYEENPEYWQRVRPPGASPTPEQQGR